jgi:hypothetical protein
MLVFAQYQRSILVGAAETVTLPRPASSTDRPVPFAKVCKRCSSLSRRGSDAFGVVR